MTEQVLALVAHPDDESLGVGATLARHVREGDSVAVVCFADGLASRGGVTAANIAKRHGMCRSACKTIGTDDVYLHQFADNMMDNVALIEVVRYIERHIERVKPTIVYTHWRSDLNVDHRVLHDAANVACRPMPGQTVRKLLYFEVPCSTRWGQGFEPNYFVPVTEADMRVKFAACECYAEEMRQFPHPRSMLGIEALAKLRGASVGFEWAEAFVVGRVIA